MTRKICWVNSAMFSSGPLLDSPDVMDVVPWSSKQLPDTESTINECVKRVGYGDLVFLFYFSTVFGFLIQQKTHAKTRIFQKPSSVNSNFLVNAMKLNCHTSITRKMYNSNSLSYRLVDGHIYLSRVPQTCSDCSGGLLWQIGETNNWCTILNYNIHSCERYIITTEGSLSAVSNWPTKFKCFI
jgi:hypothetical protein